MKQNGKTWYDHEGLPTQSKYLPHEARLAEVLGQFMATMAIDLKERLSKARVEFMKRAMEVYTATPSAAENVKTSFTFYTYDKLFKFELDIKANNVRVYQATKPKPTHKDYKLIELSINSEQMQLPAKEVEIIEQRNAIAETLASNKIHKHPRSSKEIVMEENLRVLLSAIPESDKLYVTKETTLSAIEEFCGGEDAVKVEHKKVYIEIGIAPNLWTEIPEEGVIVRMENKIGASTENRYYLDLYSDKVAAYSLLLAITIQRKNDPGRDFPQGPINTSGADPLPQEEWDKLNPQPEGNVNIEGKGIIIGNNNTQDLLSGNAESANEPGAAGDITV